MSEIETERDNYKEFYYKIKDIIRNTGKTNVISVSEIDELIVKYHMKEK